MHGLSFLRLLRHPRLSRLFTLRWTGQAIDGLFQSALASFVLFSPERQANALGAALAFAVVLLPYSIIGPFVGTVLDRVSRQRALFYANLLRSVDLLLIAFLIFKGHTGAELTAAVLAAFGINRLILAGLSAGLPLLVDTDSLIAANAMAVTGGSLWVVLGGGAGFGLRKVVENFHHNANHADALLVLVASIGYFLVALLALRLKKNEIGPLDHERSGASFGQGIKEMREGFNFLFMHNDAARGILATAVQRGGLTSLVLVALLLERNTFHSASDPGSGLSGLAVALSIAGVGIICGALIAPIGVDRYGRYTWIRYMMAGSAISPLVLILSLSPLTLYVAAFLTSFFGQSLKVTNDALVQAKINDTFRGRVFAVYDVLVNAAIVSGAVLAASILPVSGKSTLVIVLISLAYTLAYAVLLRPSRFNAAWPTS
ncbi:MAG: MFS transporter [Candidatus Nanopelagicaceae bacterium]|nr:MFS transporter [Candidatus Nanopelagicaceae bacterium]